MNHWSLRHPLWFAATVAAVSSFAAAPTTGSPAVEWLPRSFVKNPGLDVMVITETTDAGRTFAAPTPTAPAYYLYHAAGFRETGHPIAGLGRPDEAALAVIVRQQLAAVHYRPAEAAHAPTLVLLAHWGAYNRLDRDFPDVGNREMLTRVALIGGVKFADEFRRVIEHEEAVRGPGAGVPLDSTSLLSDFYRFKERNPLTRRIVEQARDDSYGFILSAYDYAALLRGERRLLWRTKVSTDASGISFAQTVPALAAAGREFYGRPMDGPTAVYRRTLDREHVELGEITEVETAAATPSPEQQLVDRELATLEKGLFDYGATKRPDAKF